MKLSQPGPHQRLEGGRGNVPLCLVSSSAPAITRACQLAPLCVITRLTTMRSCGAAAATDEIGAPAVLGLLQLRNHHGLAAERATAALFCRRVHRALTAVCTGWWSKFALPQP